MTYQALARKWRPRRFDQMVGQPHAVKVLSHALTQNKIHHAYLFTGYHGIGKTTLARIFAKCLNCETGVTATPCDQCNHCQEIDAGRFPDLFEIDAASRTKVEDTRDLLDNIPYAPTKGRFKVYLIDEVHMLSGHSFNALLKTLEEPPEHVKFLLATTDPQKLPATVLSRCLQFHLSKMTTDEIEKQLAFVLNAEKITFEPAAIALIAQAANGSMRDSLSLLDQCIAYGNNAITTAETQALLGLSNQTELTQLIQAIHTADAQNALSLTQSFANNGVNFSRCLSELLTQLYHITLLQSVENIKNSKNAALLSLAKTIDRADVQLYYQIALIGQRDLPLAPTAQMGFEMIVMRMIAFQPVSHNNEPIKNTRAMSETEVVTSSVTTRNEITDLNWSPLLNKLTLSGPTLALAQRCSMRALTQDALQLTLLPKYAALLHARHQQRIQDALIQHLNRPMRVTITIEKNTLETPADVAVRLHEASTESAKKTLSADPSIQRIVKTFDAKLIDESVEPLK